MNLIMRKGFVVSIFYFYDFQCRCKQFPFDGSSSYKQQDILS